MTPPHTSLATPPPATPLRPIKILIIDDETQILLLLRAALEKSGFIVFSLNDPRQAVETAQREKPDIVLSDLMMPIQDGYSVVAAMRKDPRTAAIPVALLTAAPSTDNLSRAFASGIVGYFEKPFHPARLPKQLRKLLADLEQRPNQLFGMLRHTPLQVVLHFLETQKRSGIFSLLAEKKEGRIVMQNGRVTEASFGQDGEAPLDAVARMQATSDGEFAFVALDGASADIISLDEEPLEIPAEEVLDATDFVEAESVPEVSLEALRKERVVIVDDDAEITRLLSRHFKNVGFDVSTATSGRVGLEMILELRPDIILSDMAMPGLDGWQLYHRVRADYRVNETRFIFLSGQSGFEQTLRALGVDAEGFFEKGVLLSSIVRRIDQILTPRRDFEAMVAAPMFPEYASRIAPLGMKYVLKTLGEKHATATLRVENLWHKLTCTIAAGKLLGCIDEGLVHAAGGDAFLELCATVNGEFTLTAGAPAAKPLGPLTELVTWAESQLTETERQVMDTHLVSARQLLFDPGLLDFYASVAPGQSQPVIDAVRLGKSPKEILSSLDMSPLEIEEVLKDLVRKRVVKLGGEG